MNGEARRKERKKEGAEDEHLNKFHSSSREVAEGCVRSGKATCYSVCSCKSKAESTCPRSTGTRWKQKWRIRRGGDATGLFLTLDEAEATESQAQRKRTQVQIQARKYGTCEFYLFLLQYKQFIFI